MELTQRLECTQESFSNQTERVCPEQIGFLGICGTKYPVKKGPNKIGRDPQTCNIVLNLNSISRQHAVLNVLNSNEYMLMDLDSANKTKLQDKTLQPYIPHPLHNGDMVQFGQVFGVFRLLEEESDLPMTQALDIPETPVASKIMSKLHHVTTVPESPDVSDKDDSFIAPSQPKSKHTSKNSIFVKSSGKTISIQPVGQKKIDNVYWSSSKKSDSFSLNNNSSLNESVISVKSSDTSEINNIHELATQVPAQLVNNHNESIFDAATQIPIIEAKKPCTPNIYSMETQVPVIDKDPISIKSTKEVNNDDKENDLSIFNAETQFYEVNSRAPSVNNTADNSKKSLNTSDDIILFDDLDSQPVEETFESQAILPTSPIFAKPKSPCPSSSHSPNIIKNVNKNAEGKQTSDSKDDDINFLPTQVIPVSSYDNSIEDIDILPTQKICKANEDDDLTDCEDEILNEDPKKPAVDDDVTDCEDDLDDKIAPNGVLSTNNIENMETQDILMENIQSHKDNYNPPACDIEDMLTQIIPVEKPQNKSNPSDDFEDMPTQVIESERPKPVLKQLSLKDYNDFKVPVLSPRKQRKKETPKTNVSKKALIIAPDNKKINDAITIDDDPNYYAATQELFEDLCTQKDIVDSPAKANKKKISSALDQSFGSSEGEDKIEQFVSRLSSQDIRDVVGVETKVVKLKKVPSDSSDIEVTPKKIRPFKFMEIDLPNSQEIKTSVTLQSKSHVTESSSDSDTENDSQQNTPILFKSKKRTKEAKKDLSKKFDVDSLPSRIITRLRKPTEKLLSDAKNQSKSMLKSNFIADQEDDINADIITENISRLKTEKSKSNENTKSSKDKVEKKDTEKKVKESSRSKKSKDTKVDKEQGGEHSKAVTEKTEKRKRGRPKKEDSKTDSINTVKTESQPNDETRRKRNTQESVKKSISPLKVEELPEKRRRVKIDITGLSPDKEIRRSRRKRTTKTNNSIDISKNRSAILKHEQSTIYNISSESGVDSPTLKREASKEISLPAKRGRPASTLGFNLRATPSRKLATQYVLFTAFPCDEVKMKLEKLGAIIVTNVKESTVVLTLQIKRTFKLLCAVGMGRPIVGPQWVQACVDNNVIVDPWLYLLKDDTTEKRFQFDLHKSLVSRRNFLKGYNVSSTPSVLPAAHEMKLIVECSGGTWKEGGSNWIVVSSPTDKALWPLFKKKGASVVSTEFVLGGVLRQKLEINRHKLT